MISADDVKKLAGLSRLALTDEEVKQFQAEIAAIIAYVDTIQKVPIPESVTPSPHLELENIMREDSHPHETGIYTEALLSQAPRREKNYLKVKKIIEQ